MAWLLARVGAVVDSPGIRRDHQFAAEQPRVRGHVEPVHLVLAVDRNLPHGFTVSRADLAACMLASLSDPATVHRHVAIAS